MSAMGQSEWVALIEVVCIVAFAAVAIHYEWKHPSDTQNSPAPAVEARTGLVSRISDVAVVTVSLAYVGVAGWLIVAWS